jgi:WD40 repeat protein
VLRAATPDDTQPPPEPVVPYIPVPGSAPCPRPVKTVEPRAWASAEAPTGELTVIARDQEVLLRRPDGTTVALGPGRPLALAFAPGGRRLATVGPGALVRTWDDRGGLLAEAHVLTAGRSVAYTPDGTRVLVLDDAGTVSVHDAQTLTQVASWTVEGPANGLTCSPDGTTVAVAFGSWLSETGWVECWSIAERREVAHYPAPGPVGATRFTPDGRVLVIGCWNGFVAWRSVAGGELIAARQLSKDAVASAAFSPDSGTLPFDPPPEPAPPPTPVVPPPELIQAIGELPRN